MDSPSPLDVGAVIAEKYELRKLLGRGGMGEVWQARHQTLGEDVAIKVLSLPASEADLRGEALRRFRFEAQTSAQLARKSRHIAQVTDYGESQGHTYLVMELLTGESLEDRLQRTRRVPRDETAEIVVQIARALSVAHNEGVLHRDLKPGNVFLTADEDLNLVTKLLDFGIARSTRPRPSSDKHTTTQRGIILGTPSYMSPEHARGMPVDARCDVWALSVLAYELLSGTLPFDAPTLEDTFLRICTFDATPIRAYVDVSPAVEAFFLKAFSKVIDARFQTALELALHLARALEATPTSTERERRSAPGIEMSKGPAAGANAPGSATLREPTPAEARGWAMPETPMDAISHTSIPGVSPRGRSRGAMFGAVAATVVVGTLLGAFAFRVYEGRQASTPPSPEIPSPTHAEAPRAAAPTLPTTPTASDALRPDQLPIAPTVRRGGDAPRADRPPSAFPNASAQGRPPAGAAVPVAPVVPSTAPTSAPAAQPAATIRKDKSEEF
jgi:eukaryotic-like serine/threonine-protein kinase